MVSIDHFRQELLAQMSRAATIGRRTMSLDLCPKYMVVVLLRRRGSGNEARRHFACWARERGRNNGSLFSALRKI